MDHNFSLVQIAPKTVYHEIETVCFNPLLVPYAIKISTPIAITAVKFPPFRVYQQVKYPRFLPKLDRLWGRGGGGGHFIETNSYTARALGCKNSRQLNLLNLSVFSDNSAICFGRSICTVELKRINYY